MFSEAFRSCEQSEVNECEHLQDLGFSEARLETFLEPWVATVLAIA